MGELTPDEALYCLEGIGCGTSETWTPQVGPRPSNLDDDQAGRLVDKLARLAGLDPEETRRAVGLVGHPGLGPQPPTTT